MATPPRIEPTPTSNAGYQLPACVQAIINNTSKNFETLSLKVKSYATTENAQLFGAGVVSGLGLALLFSVKLAGTVVTSSPIVLGTFLTLAGLGAAFYSLSKRVTPASGGGS
ncbi:MAG: hypothetical protein WC222_03960 [Parachlamydiales bacterium]|jgi:hypothetical protein